MTFPLWILLLPFILFLFVALVFVFFNLFHMARFGLQTVKTTIILGIYILSSLVAIGGIAILLSLFDWMDTVEFGSLFMLSASIL